MKLGEKKSKCRDGTDGDSEAETANAVSEQQESRGSCGCPRKHIAAFTLLFVNQCAGVGVYRSGNRIKTVVSGLG